MTLHALLDSSVSRWGDRVAVEDATGRAISYRTLGRLSDRVHDRLHLLGVRPGDRVGLHLPKSVDAVIAMFGILKAGAAYVPVDAESPTTRAAFILNDCTVSAVLTRRAAAPALLAELQQLGCAPALLVLDDDTDALPIEALLDREDLTDPAAPVARVELDADALAYILYTSGSTGLPKGVMLSHRCAGSYVAWCLDAFRPRETDRFSSHAPFHFDLSILDVFVAIVCGATLVLIGDALGREPRALAPFIAERRITVWYSVPSILNLLARHGRLERYDFSALRLVLFAGEVFPLPQFRALKEHWRTPDFFNLYGPTETNVCTYYRVPEIVPSDRSEPFPIGRACEHLECRVVDEAGDTVEPGSRGELVVSGPAVMLGYWNLPEQNASAFLNDESGRRWYRTGDVVHEDGRDGYVFHGRRDRMVKRRGYRIELGEIEAGLALHPAVREVAVVAHRDEESGVRIKAWLSTNGASRPSLIQLKQFSSEQLPRYMVPDQFGFVEALPRTSTGKVDYRALEEISGTGH